MSALDSEHPRLADRVGEDTHNVLLLAPPTDAHAEDGCVDLMTVEPPAGEDVLYVTFTESPDQRLEAWRRGTDDERPAKLGFVNVDDSSRSAVESSPARSGTALSVRSVSNPADLTDLGIQLDAYLAEWADDGNRTVVCFHSVTTLLQYVDLQRAFRFFHVITGRVRESDARAHYHVDPSAHDVRTMNTLMTLFGAVAEWDGDDWHVRNR